MVDATIVFSMISGLGGAALGTIAAVYGPVSLERRRDNTQQSSDAHTTVAKARQAGHTWLRVVNRTVQDLRAGRAVDIADFDRATEATMDAVTVAVTDLARPGVELSRALSGGVERDAPIIAGMWEITRQLRGVVLGLSTSDLGDIECQAQNTRDALGRLLQNEIEARTGHPLPRLLDNAGIVQTGPLPPGFGQSGSAGDGSVAN
ncbi:hypothetical protein ACIRYZ_36460 [Kitasatospora sp. NPDC101155]|uniref:hypothetical protein n=1 Tax=Kitasatospora sp. NPDC101155 TaxID=3364097 RepID=UPI0037F106E9